VVGLLQRRYLAAAGAGVGIQHEEAGAERRAGQGQHARQLPAAEHADADQRAFAHGCLGSGCASTSSVCLARNAARACPMAGWSAASRLAANSPALAAPAAPIAK